MTGLRSIVTASYALGLSAQAWLEGVAAAAATPLDAGYGVEAWLRQAGPQPTLLRARAGNECLAIAEEHLTEVATYLLQRHCAPSVCTLRGLLDLHGSTLARLQEQLTAVAIADVLLLTPPHSNGNAVVIAAAVPAHKRLAPAQSRRAEQVAKHLACGLRLRHEEGLRQDREGTAERAGAAVRDNTTLRMAARAADARAASIDQDDGHGAWVGLLRGHWVREDGFEADGRRYLIARETSAAPGTAGLTDRQLRILALRNLGHPLKLIAAELGCSMSTVSIEVQRALHVLGLRSIHDLGSLADT